MKKIGAGVYDFGMNGLSAAVVPSALGHSKRNLVAPEKLWGFYYLARTDRREGLKPKVNADLAIASCLILGNLTSKGHIPAPKCIANKSARLNLLRNFSRFPKMVGTPFISNLVAVEFESARDIRHPSESGPRTETGSEVGTFSVLVASRDKAGADCIDGIAVQAEIGRAAQCQIYEIKVGRPFCFCAALPSALSFPLGGNAIVPNLIGSDSQLGKMPSRGSILDAEFEREDHPLFLAVAQSRCKGEPAS